MPPGRPARKAAVSDSLAVDLALFAVVLMWASTFPLFKLAWRSLDPVAFTAVRFAAMVVFSMGLLATARSRVRLERRDVPLVVASGLTGYFLYQMAFILGLARTSALASSVLVATHPIFSVLLTWALGKERPCRIEVAGVVVGFLGVAVFLGFWDAFAGARPGDLLSLGAAASFGAYGVITRPLAVRYPSRELMAYTLGVGGVLIVVTGIPAVLHQDWRAVGGSAWLILLYAAVFPVYVAYALWNWAIRRRGVARTVVFGFLTPVLAGTLAVVGLGESFHPRQVAGGLMVVAGLILTRLRAGRGRAAPGEPLPEQVEPRATDPVKR